MNTSRVNNRFEHYVCIFVVK